MSSSEKREAGDIFSGRSRYYSLARPGYPTDIIGFLRDRIGLSPSFTVADIGAGTGLLSKLFLENGNSVFAVEPNNEMLSTAVETMRGYSGFHTVNGTAENTNLEARSIDLITCGQSFHWFNVELASPEFKRILKPGGYVLLVWNDRLPNEGGFNWEYEKICIRYSPAYHSSGSTVLTREGFEQFFESGYEEHTFPNSQALDMEGVKGRYKSASYAISASHENYSALIRSLEDGFNKYEKDGFVKIEYETKVFLGRL